MSAAIILAAALFYAAIGVAALLRPTTLLDRFGIVVPRRDARNEVRAVYGGLTLAIAAMLIVSLTDPALFPGIVITVGGISLGMAVGRLVSALLDSGIGLFPLLFLMLEGIAGLALLSRLG